METKSNVNFTRTTFYAENLGEGNFAGANIYRWECSRCGKVKNFSTMPPARGCSGSSSGLHAWRRT